MRAGSMSATSPRTGCRCWLVGGWAARLAQQVRQQHDLALLADNGNFTLIGQVRQRFAAEAGSLAQKVRAIEDPLGRSVRPGDVPAALRREFFDLTITVREAARQLAGSGEASLAEQLGLDPTHLIGVEDITAACWLALDIEQAYSGRRNRDYARMNRAVARKAARRLPRLAPALRDRYYPVASAVSYATSRDAGEAFAQQKIDRVSMGFGAFMADANFTDHAMVGRRRVDFPSRLPNRYTRTVLAARGFWDGYTQTAGKPPDGFHFLGLGAPIMLPLVILAARATPHLTFDATSPIKDALRDGVLYVTKPAYLKIRLREAARRLATQPATTWDCPCPFCQAFTKDFPFDYSKGHAWHAQNPTAKVKAADLKPAGALFDAYPLFSEPSPGARRDAVDKARVGHNHWALEQILHDAAEAETHGRIAQHVTHVVDQYTTRTTAPFANAIRFALQMTNPAPTN